ncbi:MAG: FIST C-terminal domain-containing protein [Myxococcota bacterium]
MSASAPSTSGSALVCAKPHAAGARAAASEAARLAGPVAGPGPPGALWLALGGSWEAHEGSETLIAAGLEGLEAVWPGAGEVAIATRSAGLLGAGGEWRERPAVGVLAVGGREIRAFSVPELAGEEDRAGPEAAARIGRPLEPGDAVAVWSDAAHLAPGALLASLVPSLAPARLAGGGLSPPAGEAPGFAHAGRMLGAGLVGWHVPGACAPSVQGASACHPLTPPLVVSRSRGHWVLGLDGRTALDVFREAAGGALAKDPGRAARVLKLALLDDGKPDAAEPRALSNVIGFDARRGAFSVARPVESGRRVMLVQLDADRARAELDRAVGHIAAGPPRDWAVYFGCRGRGEALFGIDGLESGLIERGMAGTPWLGVEADHQFAPGPDGASPLQPSSYAGVLIAARCRAKAGAGPIG